MSKIPHVVVDPQAPAMSHVAAIVAPVTVTRPDTQGREIGVRKLDALEIYRLTKIMGPAASVDASLNMAITVCAVRSIDGNTIMMPANERELEFLIGRVGLDGMSVVHDVLKEAIEAGNDGPKS